jgi:hypothetical protein
MRILWLLLFLSLTNPALALELHLDSRKVPLLGGDVIGGAFDEADGTIVIQQSVISTENNGLVIRSHRVLTSWDLKTMSQIGSRDFELSPRSASAHPCGRVVSVPKAALIVICSAETHLELLDSKTLKTVRTIGTEVSQNIYDFAVDQERGLVFVVAYHDDHLVRVTSYSLGDGSQKSESVLVSSSTGGLKLAIDSKTGDVVATDVYEVAHHDRSHVYVCGGVLHSCAITADVQPISEMGVLGRQLLFAVRSSANDKKDCIYGLKLGEKESSAEYCSASTGVRFAMGVVAGQYIAGFTGTSKTHIVSEETISKVSEIAVWRVENRSPAAYLSDPTDYGASQYQMRIVSSANSLNFLTFNLVTNAVYVYSIQDS